LRFDELYIAQKCVSVNKQTHKNVWEFEGSMPSRPPSLRRPGQPAPAERERLYDRRRNRQEWRTWYGTARWKAIAKQQLDEEPLCRMCKAKGKLTAATTCDHVIRHKGNPVLFWNTGNLQSLCTPCHSREKQRQEQEQA
jgi:5-methylcytosine-specific restriction endonuclease McrA